MSEFSLFEFPPRSGRGPVVGADDPGFRIWDEFVYPRKPKVEFRFLVVHQSEIDVDAFQIDER